MANKLQLAEAFLYGFTHAKRGYSIESLAESMGLTQKEWEKIKTEYPESVKGDYKADLDDYFRRKNKANG